jgi:hypothetical protein
MGIQYREKTYGQKSKTAGKTRILKKGKWEN